MTLNLHWPRHGRLWLVLVLAALLFWLGVSRMSYLPPPGTELENLQSGPIPAELKQRGEELRTAIDEAYHQSQEAFRKELDAYNRRLSNAVPYPKGNMREAIRGACLRFIPIGTSFDDAERVLRAAGFRVRVRPGPNPPSRYSDRYDVIASIMGYDQGLFYRYDLFIDLVPTSAGDYSNIADITVDVSFVSL
jgi:hypothetical protein